MVQAEPDPDVDRTHDSRGFIATCMTDSQSIKAPNETEKNEYQSWRPTELFCAQEYVISAAAMPFSMSGLTTENGRRGAGKSPQRFKELPMRQPLRVVGTTRRELATSTAMITRWETKDRVRNSAGSEKTDEKIVGLHSEWMKAIIVRTSSNYEASSFAKQALYPRTSEEHQLKTATRHTYATAQ
ncbi:unnamed protein product, partial [Mesorhabditis spiculigera]